MLTVAGTGWVVEKELRAGRLGCPGCSGVLAPWGHAREREVRSAKASWWVRPRRARCPACGVTHVLLPVVCLLRRLYSAPVIMAALVLRATSGAGWRTIADEVGVPGSTVRGWVRRFSARSEMVRVFFTRAALATGIDMGPPGPAGSPVADALAAVGLLVAAITQRFSPGPGAEAGAGAGSGFVGAVTAWQVASAASGSRLLAPGWPA